MAIDISNAVERVHASFEPEFRFVVERAAAAVVARCESPIELMLATAFEVTNAIAAEVTFEMIPDGGQPKSDTAIHVYPQFRWEGYRIDFKLECQSFKQVVFIECDGHAFHERTPDQAERDRRKDRLAQEKGIAILRFTGREIYRSPAECVVQIVDFITNRNRGGAR